MKILLKGTEVFVLKVTKKRTWYKLRVGKRKMWVKTKYVELVENEEEDDDVPDSIADEGEQEAKQPETKDEKPRSKKGFNNSSVGLFFPVGIGIKQYSGISYGVGFDLDLSMFHLDFAYNLKPSKTMDIRVGLRPSFQLGGGFFLDLLFTFHVNFLIESSAKYFFMGASTGTKIGYSVNDYFYIHISPVVLDLDMFQYIQSTIVSGYEVSFYARYCLFAGFGFRF